MQQYQKIIFYLVVVKAFGDETLKTNIVIWITDVERTYRIHNRSEAENRFLDAMSSYNWKEERREERQGKQQQKFTNEVLLSVVQVSLV